MSFILEALRRSEQERRHLEDQGNASPLPLISRPRRRLPWLLLAALISINLITLAWLLLPRQPAAPPAMGETQTEATAAPLDRQLTPRGSSLAELAGEPPPPRQRASAGQAAPVPAQPPLQQGPSTEPAPPWLAELSASFRSSLPSIHIGMYVHARQPQARFVMIDGRQYREGQDLAPGLQLLEITAHGVILNYQGQRFQMPLR